MRLMTLLMACSLLLAGCGDVERPDSNVCVVNVPALHEKCYNLKRDYDNSGNLKKDAVPTFHQYATDLEMLAGLNKRISTDPNGWANIKAYIRKLRRAKGAPEATCASDFPEFDPPPPIEEPR